jgi:hypothetical protein
VITAVLLASGCFASERISSMELGRCNSSVSVVNSSFSLDVISAKE